MERPQRTSRDRIKRAFDVAAAGVLLAAASPILAVAMVMIWRQDGHSPFYIAPRIGRFNRPFMLFKLRSMVVNAAASGVDSTAGDDPRVTAVGRFIRRTKLDELPQLWNVVRGDMSLVGPRPNVERGTRVYTQAEQRLLSVQPGVTDFASIVFADEGDILAGQPDPDAAYDALIRPWKSRLGLFYVARRSLPVDLALIGLTALALLSRRRALEGVVRLLTRLGAPLELIRVSGRQDPLTPQIPPGAGEAAQA